MSLFKWALRQLHPVGKDVGKLNGEFLIECPMSCRLSAGQQPAPGQHKHSAANSRQHYTLRMFLAQPLKQRPISRPAARRLFIPGKD